VFPGAAVALTGNRLIQSHIYFRIRAFAHSHGGTPGSFQWDAGTAFRRARNEDCMTPSGGVRGPGLPFAGILPFYPNYNGIQVIEEPVVYSAQKGRFFTL